MVLMVFWWYSDGLVLTDCVVFRAIRISRLQQLRWLTRSLSLVSQSCRPPSTSTNTSTSPASEPSGRQRFYFNSNSQPSQRNVKYEDGSQPGLRSLLYNTSNFCLPFFFLLYKIKKNVFAADVQMFIEASLHMNSTPCCNARSALWWSPLWSLFGSSCIDLNKAFSLQGNWAHS